MTELSNDQGYEVNTRTAKFSKEEQRKHTIYGQNGNMNVLFHLSHFFNGSLENQVGCNGKHEVCNSSVSAGLISVTQSSSYLCPCSSASPLCPHHQLQPLDKKYTPPNSKSKTLRPVKGLPFSSIKNKEHITFFYVKYAIK